MIYNQPLKGKLGMKSAVSKNMVFAICCDTKKECLDLLYSRISYYDRLKYRWRCVPWDDKDIEKYNENKQEYKEYLNYKKEQINLLKQNKQFVKENLNKLTESQKEKFIHSGRYPVNLHNHKDAICLMENILSGKAYKE